MTEKKYLQMKKIKVWDAQTRIFHWTLLVYALCAFITADLPELFGYDTINADVWLGFHIGTGAAVGILLAFRVFWGFFGTYYSRFSAFHFSIKNLADYLMSFIKGRKPSYTGHNPCASWTATGIVVTGIGAVLTGMLVYGADEGRGILRFLYNDLYQYAGLIKLMHRLTVCTLLGIVFTHVSGVLLETILFRTGIIHAMLSGKKYSNEEERAVSGGHLLTVVSFIWVLSPLPAAFYFYNSMHSVQPTRIFVPAVYKQECASCHMAFPPNALPAKSWQAMMSNLQDHFGDDASLEENVRTKIEEFLVKNSAENSAEEASIKFLGSIGKGNPVLRISEIDYWKNKHRNIKPEIYKRESIKSKINCVSCHKWAEYGSFEDSDIKIPRQEQAALDGSRIP